VARTDERQSRAAILIIVLLLCRVRARLRRRMANVNAKRSVFVHPACRGKQLYSK
jgi:hypothetical protein